MRPAVWTEEEVEVLVISMVACPGRQFGLLVPDSGWWGWHPTKQLYRAGLLLGRDGAYRTEVDNGARLRLFSVVGGLEPIAGLRLDEVGYHHACPDVPGFAVVWDELQRRVRPSGGL